jgi:hypothetical protein
VHASACIWINAWLLILDQCTDVFVYYCSLLYTILCKSVETVAEYRLNGFLIPFERFVKAVRRAVKFFVFIRSYFLLKTSKTFWGSVETIWQSVYYPFVIRFFARFNAKSLTYVFPWKVTYSPKSSVRYNCRDWMTHCCQRLTHRCCYYEAYHAICGRPI